MVSLWKEFWANPYKFLWSRIGGRPWTYISRDVYHRVEYVILVSLFSGGFFLGLSGELNWRWFVILIGVYTLGFIHGHFFWGTNYIEGQKNNGTSNGTS